MEDVYCSRCGKETGSGISSSLGDEGQDARAVSSSQGASQIQGNDDTGMAVLAASLSIFGVIGGFISWAVTRNGSDLARRVGSVALRFTLMYSLLPFLFLFLIFPIRWIALMLLQSMNTSEETSSTVMKILNYGVNTGIASIFPIVLIVGFIFAIIMAFKASKGIAWRPPGTPGAKRFAD